MKIKIYLLVISFNLFAIGFDAIEIYTFPNDLSLSGAGVASRELLYGNPAIRQNENSTISFSSNKFNEYSSSGNSLLFSKKGYALSISSQKIDDIEIRDEIPLDNPLDIVALPFLSIGISKGIELENNLQLGVGVHYYYSDLWIEKDKEFTFDFGLKKIFLKNFQIGCMIKDVSINQSKIPINYIAGISYLNERYNTEVLLDYNYSNSYHNAVHVGVIQKIKILTLNFGYSSNLFDIYKTTISSGFKVNINNNYSFLYSFLSHLNTNLGPSHYFGVEISI